MILPSIWCVNPAILWWRCLCFSPQTFFLRFMSCCFFFLFSFLLSTRHLFVVLYTNRSPEFTDWIPTMCSSNVLYLCACPFSLRSSVMIIIFSSSPSPPLPFVHFDDFIAPNVFTIMSAVSYCYSLTERHNHKEKPRDPLTGYFQKLYVDYLVLGSIFIQSIFDFQTKTEEVDFLGIYSRVSRPLEVNRFFSTSIYFSVGFSFPCCVSWTTFALITDPVYPPHCYTPITFYTSLRVYLFSPQNCLDRVIGGTSRWLHFFTRHLVECFSKKGICNCCCCWPASTAVLTRFKN